MRLLFLLSLFLFFQGALLGQVNKHGGRCGGMDILDVGIHIKGFAVQHENEIAIDFLRKGFTIALLDSSYIIESMVVFFTSRNKVREYSIGGAVLNRKKAKFLKTIKAGDFLSVDCVNIRKGDSHDLSTGLWIVATR